jgi:hypothetical protein
MNMNMLSYHETMCREGVVLYYNGPISQSVVEGVGDMMRRKMVLEDNGMQLAQKVFSVLVEQMQNVICYAQDICTPAVCMGTGQIMVGRNGEEFYVACGNPVSRNREARIRERIDIVNGMSRDELKAYYKEQRRKGPDEDSCGAGLGFIEMARKASRPLQYRFDPIDDETSFFAVKVHV